MKTLQLSKMTGMGLICLISGIILLGVSFYLYEIDFQLEEKIRQTPTPTNPAYMCCIPPLPPYGNIQPYLTMIGVILIGVGTSLLSYKQIKNRMKVRK